MCSPAHVILPDTTVLLERHKRNGFPSSFSLSFTFSLPSSFTFSFSLSFSFSVSSCFSFPFCFDSLSLLFCLFLFRLILLFSFSFSLSHYLPVSLSVSPFHCFCLSPSLSFHLALSRPLSPFLSFSFSFRAKPRRELAPRFRTRSGPLRERCRDRLRVGVATEVVLRKQGHVFGPLLLVFSSASQCI